MTSRSIRRAAERRALKQAHPGARRALALGAGAASAASAALGASVVYAPAARAATFSVTTLTNAGAGSLRSAVNQANAAPGADTITFDPALTGRIELSAVIDITDSTTISGPGAGQLTVDGNEGSRIFTVTGDTSGAGTVISGLTLTGGYAEVDFPNGLNGVGAALYAYTGDLTVTDMAFTGNNAARSGGAIGFGFSGNSAVGDVVITGSTFTDNVAGYQDGGAILVGYYSADATMSDVTVTDNSALQGSGGGIAVQGGQNISIADSTISGNDAKYGGGTYLDDSSAISITDTLISANNASYGGGGVFAYEPQGPVIITGSTISGNSSVYGGGLRLADDGGLYFDVDIVNTTITGNTAEAKGGGIYLYLDVNEPYQLTITDSTITSNSATVAAGGIAAADGDKVLQGTIVADNANGDLSLEGGGDEPFSLDFSLVEDPGPAGTTVAVTAGSNLLGVDPQLGALANNGGPTPTQLPALTSPAIDKNAAFGVTTDQRRLSRPGDRAEVANATGGNGADIGAVELTGTTAGPPATPTPPAAGNLGTCKGEPVTILARAGVPTGGTPGRDVVLGTAGPDVISTGDGNDLICAAGGDDRVSSGAGNDQVYGNAGHDHLRGNGGKDRLVSGKGKDRVSGGRAKDTLVGKKGDDTLFGRKGNDRLSGGAGDDDLAGGQGTDKLKGGPGQNTTRGRQQY